MADHILELGTERLLLRQWRDSDREAFAYMCADPKVMEFLWPVGSRAASDALIDCLVMRMAENGWGIWATELRTTGEFIGFIGLQEPRAKLPCSPCVEVGWRLASRFWGHGYATEGAHCALAVGFEKLWLHEIVAMTAVKNVRSQAVMQRLGMRPDRDTFFHPLIPLGHRLREHCLYRLGREEWFARSRPG